MSIETFVLWAFGVLCGAAAMWFFHAYEETKGDSLVETQRDGGKGEEK
jgi:hypothetical protein